MTTELIHTYSSVGWITDEGKKFLLTFEMEIEKDTQQWMPTESQLQFLVYRYTPHFVGPSSVFDRYGITEAEFDYLIEHDIATLQNIINNILGVFTIESSDDDFKVTQMAISSIPCKFYDKEKHEYED